ncbi:efflux RND transporter permease subunit [Aliikangiella coralliicola]|uniref:Efflux RND transporter permease subunit n=1 Tax=Aliikangiella coralliicola TaxID=2592383 RepID=A0A545U0F7_9GAMM|nr:efflux RND transporter permease subunit [Aliikangiella coralliicola]TQV82949.1 efflux RND transporter permease subunit [Aliikangiella coralliicola]
MWLRQLIQNHVLTNLLFGLILLMGTITYFSLPREQDPTVNFNWVQITTFFQGASAKDVERKVTDIIEESIEKIQDIKFVSSTSRESISSILVRFNDIGDDAFDKRLADLRREINNIEDQLPEESERPDIFEVTTANAYPTATVVVSGPSDDENLRRHARILEKDLGRIKGVDRVQPTGLKDPEIQVQFDIEKIQLLNISPVTIADSIRSFYQDTSAGSARIANDQWLVRIEGTTTEPDKLAQIPILSREGNRLINNTEIRLGDVARVVRERSKDERLVRLNGKPAVLFAVMKQENSNTLELVKRISEFVDQRNTNSEKLGVEFSLVDDQTLITRNALDIMQTNALYGLILVLFVTWIFLGSKISLLVTIGIPFTLAGTFIALKIFGQTLNTSVLLAIVIALGMLVDDAVVVVESIYHKLRRGANGIEAAWSGLTEVIGPVTASVFTTIAAFLPLMLMPGILGKFMMVIPLVVTLALLISLIEAYWMLPGHVMAAKVSFDNPSKIDAYRRRFIHWIKIKYGLALIKVMRHPRKTLAGLFGVLIFAMGSLAIGLVRVDFFAADTIRLFYVNVEMPTSSSLDETMEKILLVEKQAREKLDEQETRSVVSYAGQMFTETAPMYAENIGQVLVSLKPRKGEMRTVEQIIEEMRGAVTSVVGPVNVSFTKLAGGPPTSKPISVKVRGDDYAELRAATDTLGDFLKADEEKRFIDVTDDDSKGRQGLTLKLNYDAINRLGVLPNTVYRIIKSLVDGEIVSYVQHEGDRIALRLKSTQAVTNRFTDIDALLTLSVPTPGGENVPLRSLVEIKVEQVKGNLRHYNFRRTITLESDINKQLTDTVAANNLLKAHWEKIDGDYPNVSLDFSGELDDIQESMDAMGVLFLFGIGLMYLILSTQFQSYFQPLMMLFTVPMAFTGVVLGLIVSGNPLSLFTLYGVVALAGIAVNAAIVLISRANANLDKGMSLIHSTFYAARRRVLPIIITTLTTVAGLFSLAVGLGGHSLIWAPVATAIVWGLIFSSMLTLFVVPVLYETFMQRSKRRQKYRTQAVASGHAK